MEPELENRNDMKSSDPLARRLADGDPCAPRELVESHHTELYRYARSLLRDAPAAEDAVQEAFEKAFVALGRYSHERIEILSLRPWLYRITLNVVRNAWRDGRHEVPAAKTPEDGGQFGKMADSTSGADREAWLDTLEAIGWLAERQRVAVTLRYLEDLSYAEIAGITGWPENTCKTLVRRGIRRLGILMDEPDKKGGL
jgi:RNA polymerase sigma-70 factor (ECF subfamily)